MILYVLNVRNVQKGGLFEMPQLHSEQQLIEIFEYFNLSEKIKYL
jgi:hypothetical protein